VSSEKKKTTQRYALPYAIFFLLFSAACTTTHPPQSGKPVATLEKASPAKIETQKNTPGEKTSPGEESRESPVDTQIAEEEKGEEQQSETESTEETVDYDAIQQEALDLCQSAEEFLDQGDLDNSLDAVDHAYELMLKLPQNHDEQYLQAREDIRRLIAKIIQIAYSAPSASLNPVHSFDLGLALVENEKVKREIKSFSTVEKESFLAAYKRSGRYRSMILEKLAEAGLPGRLSWLPLVESNFKVKAYSRASALGLWQFIASTGQRYGLSRNAWIDERMDPEKSTDAAIAYLSELHDLFGDWPKALAAYNCGEARVARLQRSHPNQYLDFWDLYNLLPRETRRYVPRFFATLLILEDPEKYGVSLPPTDPPLDGWVEVDIHRSVKLSTLDKELGLSKGYLQELNPELRSGATPKNPYRIRVPEESASLLVETIDTIPEWKPPTPAYVVHRVRRGQTLSGIANRYHIPVRGIMRMNNLRSANRIWPGQRLKIPTRGSYSPPRSPSHPPVAGSHTVRQGESLYSIARRYRTTVDRLRRDNNLKSNLIHPGQQLKISTGSQSNLKHYTVHRGDTLGRIAKSHHVALKNLLRANGLSSRSRIYPGQVLVIP